MERSYTAEMPWQPSVAGFVMNVVRNALMLRSDPHPKQTSSLKAGENFPSDVEL